MWKLILLPFIVQVIVISLDEICFHIKRNLPKWERIGHPIDTLSVFSCFLYVLFIPYSSFALKIYIALSVFSCLLVTKDEFVHKHHCPAAEHWLHALLFINHPVLLTALGLLWPLLNGMNSLKWLNPWQYSLLFLKIFISIQSCIVFLFMLYQIIYWNFIWRQKTQ